ncbi:MAG TPA: DinB family protein, partial [Dehalococcoidia bacterium]|nr:DinB family protein [Dehalococcoidia bacterium]
MTSIWVESLGRNFEQALDLLAEAVRECPDKLWEVGMWEVPADLFGPAPPGPDGQPVTDPAARHALVQRRSTPWSVAWHALECLDYDLTAEFGPWAPPPPFTGKPHWMMTSLLVPWTRPDILGYVDYCRQRVRDTLADMTDEKAATPLPQSHRYRGQPYASIVAGAVGHTFEHAAQIRQFVTSSTRAAE